MDANQNDEGSDKDGDLENKINGCCGAVRQTKRSGASRRAR